MMKIALNILQGTTNKDNFCKLHEISQRHDTDTHIKNLAEILIKLTPGVLIKKKNVIIILKCTMMTQSKEEEIELEPIQQDTAQPIKNEKPQKPKHKITDEAEDANNSDDEISIMNKTRNTIVEQLKNIINRPQLQNVQDHTKEQDAFADVTGTMTKGERHCLQHSQMLQ